MFKTFKGIRTDKRGVGNLKNEKIKNSDTRSQQACLSLKGGVPPICNVFSSFSAVYVFFWSKFVNIRRQLKILVNCVYNIPKYRTIFATDFFNTLFNTF